MKQSINKVPKRANRPAQYKSSIMQKLFELIAEGKTTRECVKELDVSWPTLRKWLEEKTFHQQYLKARSDSVLFTIDDLDNILKEAHENARNKKLTMTEVKLIELIQKNVHFRSSKLNPQIFGSEKQMMSIQDSKGNEFKVEWQK
mgnify:FL=1